MVPLLPIKDLVLMADNRSIITVMMVHCYYYPAVRTAAHRPVLPDVTPVSPELSRRAVDSEACAFQDPGRALENRDSLAESTRTYQRPNESQGRDRLSSSTVSSPQRCRTICRRKNRQMQRAARTPCT